MGPTSVKSRGCFTWLQLWSSHLYASVLFSVCRGAMRILVIACIQVHVSCSFQICLSLELGFMPVIAQKRVSHLAHCACSPILPGLPALRRPSSWPAQYSEIVVSNSFRMYFASSIYESGETKQREMKNVSRYIENDIHLSLYLCVCTYNFI